MVKYVVSFSKNNWESQWFKQKQDLRKISRNLDFIWKSPFKIPEGFDQITFNIAEPETHKELIMPFMQLAKNQSQEIEILYNGEYQHPIEFDFANFQVMLENGDIAQYKPNSQINVRIPVGSFGN